MSEYNPVILRYRSKVLSEEYRQKARNKIVKFLDENPDMEAYLDWRENNCVDRGLILGSLLAIAIMFLGFEFYWLGVMSV